jgi:hypothetical protein
MSGPIVDTQGNLYGNSGVVFQMTPGPRGWRFNVIYGRSESDRVPNNNPGQCDLLLDAAGNLYGPCFSFGKNYNGAVSELSPGPTGWKEKNLYDFCTHPRGGICQGGNYPGFQLSRDAAGNLYGVTMEGGVHKAGVAFELEHTAEGWKEHVLHSFPAFAGDGYYFTAGVTLDPAGNVYGTTLQGGNDGTVYKLSRQPDGAWKETILWTFPTPTWMAALPRADSCLTRLETCLARPLAEATPNARAA